MALNKSVTITQEQQNAFRVYSQVIAYAEEYHWMPPPYFIIGITFVQLVLFVVNIPYPCIMEYLKYSPHHRSQIWRFFTYMFVHKDIDHLLPNMAMQLVIGLPMEMSNGPIQIALVYVLGVLSGSLATAVFAPTTGLIGASGGDYALIASILATFILNWKDDAFIIRKRLRKGKNTVVKDYGTVIRCLKLLFILMYVGFDIFKIFVKTAPDDTSNLCHFFGSIAGLLVGIIVLKNRKVVYWEKALQVACIFTFINMIALLIIIMPHSNVEVDTNCVNNNTI